MKIFEINLEKNYLTNKVHVWTSTLFIFVKIVQGKMLKLYKLHM